MPLLFRQAPILLLLWAGFSSASLPAQEVVHRRLAASDGLPSSAVYQVTTDAEGYLWLSTNAGLARFDGNTFTTYTTGEGLPDNEVIQMVQGASTGLWFTTAKGIPGKVIQGQAEAYLRIPKLARHKIASVFVDNQQRIWFGTYDKWVFETRNDSILAAYQIPEPASKFFAQNPHGDVFLAGEKPGQLFRFRQGRWNQFLWPINETRPLPQPLLWHKTDNSWLLGLGNKLYAGLPETQPELVWEAHAPEAIIQDMAFDSEGHLWLGTTLGIFELAYFPETYAWKTQGHFLKDLRIQSLAVDYEGNIWAATPGAGLYFVPQARTLRFSQGNKPAANHIRCLLKLSDGRMLAGTDDGSVFGIYQGKTFSFLPPTPNYLSQGVHQMIQHSDGSIWIASEQGVFRAQKGRPKLVFDAPARSISEGLDGEIWVGSGNELIQLGRNGQLLQKQLVGRIGHTLFHAELDGLLYTSEWGINLFRNGVNRFWVDGSTFHNHRISSLSLDSKRKLLWVGTLGSGVFGLKGKEILFHFTVGKGLRSNMVNHLSLATDGSLWVAGRHGLDRLQPENGDSRHFSETNGLLAEEINRVCLQGDSVWAATNEGVNLFNYANMRQAPPPPPLRIAAIRVNGTEVSQAELDKLDHNRNNLEIVLNGISFSHPQGISYTYRLEGLDSNWYRTNSNRMTFEALPPGSYHFKAYALDAAGQASAQAVEFLLYIRPAYWQTILFRVFMALIAFGLLLLFILLRIKYIKRREKEKTEYNKVLNELKLTALKAQMNPHFLFNSLGSIQNLINTDKKKEANQYLSKFARLLRMILDQSDQKDVSLRDKIGLLELYLGLESLRFSNRFHYRIEVPEHVEQDSIRIPPMIIQPFVENAIKHGLLPKKEGAELFIFFDTRPNKTLYCLIEDNGIGRVKRETLKSGSQQADYISRGIQITKDRLQLVNELRGRPANFNITDLYNSEGHPDGTRVEFFIPFD